MHIQSPPFVCSGCAFVVVWNEWWGIFPGVQCATLKGEATGAVMTTRAVVMYKNLEAPVYWQCWLEHARAHIKFHPHVCLLLWILYSTCSFFWSHMLGSTQVHLLLSFSSFRSVAPLWKTWSFSGGSTCHTMRREEHDCEKENNAFTSHHPIFDACILVTEINYYVHNLALQSLFFSAHAHPLHMLDAHIHPVNNVLTKDMGRLLLLYQWLGTFVCIGTFGLVYSSLLHDRSVNGVD